MKLHAISAAICSLALLAGCATTSTQRASFNEDDIFAVQGKNLFKGKYTVYMKAIQVPELGKTGSNPDVLVPALARIAEVGGNTLCYDLQGWSADYTKLDPAALETIRFINTRADEQRMAVMIRVMPQVKDETARETAVRAAARAFASKEPLPVPPQKDPADLDSELTPGIPAEFSGLAVYWIDGPDAAKLARAFREEAPSLVVAAPGGGHIRTIEAADAAKGKGKSLVVGAIPPVPFGVTSYVLAGADADYTALDQALMNPAEQAAWTPDNSLLSEAERAEGFVSLFDGKTLNGWWVWGLNKQGFQVTPEGTIERSGEGGDALYSRERYDNFIFRWDFKIDAGGNSGVHFRAPRDARQSKIGFEFQIMGDYGIAPEEHCTGAIYDQVKPLVNAGKMGGEWNSAEVMLNGTHIRATLNGQVVQDMDMATHPELKYRLQRGFIDLQDHDSHVEFRNIRIKKL